MKKLLLISILLCSALFYLVAQGESDYPESQVNPATAENKGFHFFNIYFEWGFGDLLEPNPNKRMIREEIDVKASWLYTFASVPWLALGLTSQFKVNPKWNGQWDSGGKTSMPTSFVISAEAMFARLLSIGVGSDGTMTVGVYHNQPLPDVKGLKAHNFIIFQKNTFFLYGNARDATTGRIKQGWWDSSELRLQYLMRFNDYVGLRPEAVFMIIGTGILDSKPFLDNFMIRLNPRLYFYAPGGWSFFAEPRFFFTGFGSPTAYQNKPAVELKFGIDYAALWQ